jgi:hypothetical protein
MNEFDSPGFREVASKSILRVGYQKKETAARIPTLALTPDVFCATRFPARRRVPEQEPQTPRTERR